MVHQENSWRVRRADLGDAEMLALAGAATFLDAFAGLIAAADIARHCAREHSPARYRGWLEDGVSSLWLTEAGPGDAPIGYAVLTTPDLPLPNLDRDIELKRIYLLSRFQGSGAATAMMDAAIASAVATGKRRLLLGTYRENARAIAFYERSGFVEIGRRQFRVGDTSYDDIVMARTLG